MSSVRIMTGIATDWAIRCFGLNHVTDEVARSQRFLEEAAELVQSIGLSETDALRVIAMVYSRPKGSMRQETGGVMLTLSIMCNLFAIDVEDAMEAELRRVLAKTPEYFRKRNDEKVEALKS